MNIANHDAWGWDILLAAPDQGGTLSSGVTPAIAISEIESLAEMRLLSRCLDDETGFDLERLAAILDNYREACRQNEVVTGVQRAMQEILDLLNQARAVSNLPR